MKSGKPFAYAVALCLVIVSFGSTAQTQPTVSRHIFLEADLNKDGAVDLAEFHKDIVRSFHALDHNRDGYLSADEVHSIPDKGRTRPIGERMLKAADRNGDGKLSFKEVVEARMDFFDEADANKNERLTLEEVLAFDAKRAQQASAGAAAKKK